ncbi:MAG: hypothetical protein MUO26_12140 [Methanotrichaceae archaeon]|nr:hypothetical protein [Methanotrichaceae archaeon]
MLISLDQPRFPGCGLVTNDPAVRDMLISLDKPMDLGPSPIAIAAGNWHLKLGENKSMDLSLLQSGTIIFGRGTLNSGKIIQSATTNGELYGGFLRLDVVPDSGTELYSISLNIGTLPLTGTYMRFMAGDEPLSGTAEANWIAA